MNVLEKRWAPRKGLTSVLRYCIMNFCRVSKWDYVMLFFMSVFADTGTIIIPKCNTLLIQAIFLMTCS
jgi:hypothetical protein